MNDKKQATPRDVDDEDMEAIDNVPIGSLNVSGYLNGLTVALDSAIRNGTTLQIEVGLLEENERMPVAEGIDASVFLRSQFNKLNAATVVARAQKKAVGDSPMTMLIVDAINEFAMHVFDACDGQPPGGLLEIVLDEHTYGVLCDGDLSPFKVLHKDADAVSIMTQVGPLRVSKRVREVDGQSLGQVATRKG